LIYCGRTSERTRAACDGVWCGGDLRKLERYGTPYNWGASIPAGLYLDSAFAYAAEQPEAEGCLKQNKPRREEKQDARDYQLIPKLKSRLDLLLRIAQSVLVPRALAPYLVRIRLYHDLRLHGWVIPYTRDLEDLSIFDDRIHLRPYRPRAYKSSPRLMSVLSHHPNLLYCLVALARYPGLQPTKQMERDPPSQSW
jgi:hypothetical protein